MGENIRRWYMENFPSDELGEEIDKEATFWGLFDALDFHGDVYKFLGVWDSVIRERCFVRLAEITGMPYEIIYNQWLGR